MTCALEEMSGLRPYLTRRLSLYVSCIETRVFVLRRRVCLYRDARIRTETSGMFV